MKVYVVYSNEMSGSVARCAFSTREAAESAAASVGVGASIQEFELDKPPPADFLEWRARMYAEHETEVRRIREEIRQNRDERARLLVIEEGRLCEWSFVGSNIPHREK
jgi:acyl-CoA reductase-like NAD-dependent aldehyde dehydrogenase